MVPTLRRLSGIPLLTLNVWGVRLNVSGLQLSWSNISEIRIIQVVVYDEVFPILLFVAIDNERACKEQRRLARRTARHAVRAHGGPLLVPCGALEEFVSIEDVLSAIRRFSSIPIRERPPESDLQS
jgi:hypothetical protein